MEIVVRPSLSGRGRFEAVYAGEVLAVSRTPFLSAARELQRRGVREDADLIMRHEGSAVVAMRSTVGAAARLSVYEPDCGMIRFGSYRPWNGVSARAGSSNSGVCGLEAAE
jgi:hypothetical protein